MSGIFRFINTGIATVGCNLRCEYCYIRQHGDEEKLLAIGRDRARFRYPVAHMLKALSVERMGGICMFNISGSGETLLCPELLEITEGLLKHGHYVGLVSNCTISERIKQLAGLPSEYRGRLLVKASFHYRELKKRDLLDVFAENVILLKNAGISFALEIVSNDAALSEIEALKAFSLSHFGALPHVLLGRDEQIVGTYPRGKTRLSPEEYDRVWGAFESDLFVYQQRSYETPHHGFCYAGVYAGSLDLGTGNFSPCPGAGKVTNFFEDVDKPIAFVPVGRACPFEHCFCSFFLHVFAGVDRAYDPQAYFYQFRDRTTTHGSHWLTPTIREVFSHRCSEFHIPYAEDKQFFFTMLMQKAYKNIDPSPCEMEQLAYIVGGYLSRKGYKTVAIYGMGRVGAWLLEVLRAAGAEVVCAIDRRHAEISCDVPIRSPEDAMPSADAVIVSVYAEFTNIAPRLRAKTGAPILSVAELAGESGNHRIPF